MGRDALHEAQEPRASVTGSSVPSVTAELGRAGPGALRSGPIRAPGLQLCAFNLCDLVGRVTALSLALAPRRCPVTPRFRGASRCSDGGAQVTSNWEASELSLPSWSGDPSSTPLLGLHFLLEPCTSPCLRGPSDPCASTWLSRTPPPPTHQCMFSGATGSAECAPASACTFQRGPVC